MCFYPDSFMSNFDKMLEHFPEDLDLLHEALIDKLQLNDLSDAVNLVNKLVELKTEDSKHLNSIAIYYLNIDDKLKARQFLQQALAKNPLQPQTLTNLGNLLVAENEISQAKKCYTKALLCDERLIDAYNGLAQCYCNEQDFTSAIDVLKKAYNLAPDNVKVQNNLTKIQQALKFHVAQ